MCVPRKGNSRDTSPGDPAWDAALPGAQRANVAPSPPSSAGARALLFCWGPLYLCAPGQRSPGAPAPRQEPEALPEKGAEGKGWEAGGGPAAVEGESVTLVHRPHDAEGLAVPQLERSLSLHLEGMGAWRAV